MKAFLIPANSHGTDRLDFRRRRALAITPVTDGTGLQLTAPVRAAYGSAHDPHRQGVTVVIGDQDFQQPAPLKRVLERVEGRADDLLDHVQLKRGHADCPGGPVEPGREPLVPRRCGTAGESLEADPALAVLEHLRGRDLGTGGSESCLRGSFAYSAWRGRTLAGVEPKCCQKLDVLGADVPPINSCRG